MKNLRYVQRYLGIEFQSTPTGIFIHQTDYCQKLLADFGMQDCKLAAVPIPDGTTLISDTSTADVDVTHYCQIVGKLIYLTNTRPDLVYSVGILSRFMSRPQQRHLDVAHHVLCMLKLLLTMGSSFQSLNHFRLLVTLTLIMRVIVQPAKKLATPLEPICFNLLVGLSPGPANASPQSLRAQPRPNTGTYQKGHARGYFYISFSPNLIVFLHCMLLSTANNRMFCQIYLMLKHQPLRTRISICIVTIRAPSIFPKILFFMSAPSTLNCNITSSENACWRGRYQSPTFLQQTIQQTSSPRHFPGGNLSNTNTLLE